MDFKIDDILNNTIDRIPKETLSTIIADVISEINKNVNINKYNKKRLDSAVISLN